MKWNISKQESSKHNFRVHNFPESQCKEKNIYKQNTNRKTNKESFQFAQNVS